MVVRFGNTYVQELRLSNPISNLAPKVKKSDITVEMAEQVVNSLRPAER